jgi:predicted secreted protein
MAGKVGRQDVFTWGGDTIEGVRSKGLAIAGEAIDLTSDDDDGWRKLDTIAGENSVTLSISGVTKDRRLIADWFNGDRTKEIEFVFAKSGGTITGDFFLSSLTETGEYNGAATFDAELQSTGQPAYVAGAVPANTVLPAVIGTPQVGVQLTGYLGEWTGAPTSFAIQWQQDDSGWANISGATSVNFTPVIGNLGNALRIIVTPTNSAGAGSPATSGPSADVIAA